ncbi:hypothetical protein [Dactylosporangium sp. CA-233914]|uniref:hypothetical protein n=1 Tax=Dactylosporangium sp. CA-233914 TaxID=3239934 RepID=UPI003D8C658C
MSVQFAQQQAYTEVAHTADADVSGAEPIEAGGRQFSPIRVTAHIRWRTHVGYGWVIERIEISGPWLPDDGGTAPKRSGRIITWLVSPHRRGRPNSPAAACPAGSSRRRRPNERAGAAEAPADPLLRTCAAVLPHHCPTGRLRRRVITWTRDSRIARRSWSCNAMSY